MILIIALFAVQIVLFIMLVSVNMKYNRLKRSYHSFMRGRDGKTLEDSVKERLENVDSIKNAVRQNRHDIKELYKTLDANYQKTGIVKYDAFQEMGGNLSFALTLLNGNDSGWIINAMHSREGCYTYIKEIVNGKSYVELSEEEAESLDKAICQEAYEMNKTRRK